MLAILGRWLGALTPRQVIPKELMHMERGQSFRRNSPSLQPATEMFNDMNMTAESCAGVTTHTKIVDKEPENYAS
jgi:hypothetical protein